MKYSFDGLPKYVVVEGAFDANCILYLSEESDEALRLHNLKLWIRNFGKKPVIKNFQLRIFAISGDIKIFVGDDDADVVFQENSSGYYDLRLWRKSKIVIGNRTTSNGTKIVCDNSEFLTGFDCMFSDDILIQSSDQHGLVDLKTGDIFNNLRRKIALGNHVWLGRRCVVMPDVNIGNGSVIGTGAVVTSDIQEHSVAVGIPARVVRTDITWSRSPTNLDDASKEYVAALRG